MSHFIKFRQLNVAQRFLAEETRTGFALLAAGIVFAADQRALEVTVDNHNRDAFWHRNSFGAQRAAINQQSVIFFA
ncbi:hypothetical protein D3C75_1270590 [compost metagenome]